MAKKILLLVGDYSEELETYVPFHSLPAIGYTVHAVCPGKKVGEKVILSVHDMEPGY